MQTIPVPYIHHRHPDPLPPVIAHVILPDVIPPELPHFSGTVLFPEPRVDEEVAVVGVWLEIGGWVTGAKLGDCWTE